MTADALRNLLARPEVARVLEVLDGDGEETRIVGGAVRDALLGRPVREIDLATTALPKTTMRRAAAAGLRAIPTGLAHGTVTVIADGAPFEVTTLREDVATDGRHAAVRFGRDFALDASRRDFTVNALSVDWTGALHDPVGGMADLRAGRIRFIGEARRRIREDFLRILRFLRFHAEYATGPIDRDGIDAAIREREGLRRLSRERVRAELLRLLLAGRAVETVGIAQDAGLLQLCLGGIGDLGRLDRAASGAWAGDDAVRRLAALAVFAPSDAERLRDALRLSNAEAARLGAYGDAVARLRSGRSRLDARTVRRVAAEFGAEALGDALAALDGEPRPVLDNEARVWAGRLVTGAETVPMFPLGGADLIRRGVAPGPELGRLLAAARQDWLAAGCPATLDLEAVLTGFPVRR